MRKNISIVFLLIIFLIGILFNLYRLQTELKYFYNQIIGNEISRIEALIESTVASGGDPVDAITSYLGESSLLRGASVQVGGRDILIPGSSISDDYYIRELHTPPFTFTLYFDFSNIKELNRHIFLVIIFFLGFGFSFTIFTGVYIYAYFRERMSREKEKMDKDRLNELNLIIHSLLHEVKNRLNILKLLLYKIEKSGGKESINRLSVEINKMAEYLENTSDIGKEIIIKPVEVNIKSLVKHISEQYMDILGNKGIELSVDVENVKLMIDKDKFETVLSDLLKNAIEAFDGYDIDSKKIIISGRTKENKYIIKVTDNMGALKTDKIFTPYSSTKEKGFGLGLFNAKRVIEAGGGKIKAYVKDKMTIFEIEIPIAK